jgi:hypothetical protein
MQRNPQARWFTAPSHFTSLKSPQVLPPVVQRRSSSIRFIEYTQSEFSHVALFRVP